MNKEQYLKKQAAIVKAQQAIGVVTAQASTAVDEFFTERQEKLDNYVPQKLLVKPLPIGLYRVVFEDGVGNLPTILSGTYTSIHQAQKAIDLYISCRDKK